MFLVIMAIMLAFAVLSNSLVIYCVVRLKKLRTITNVFICNLSISDILLAGFILPQKLHDIFHKEEYFEGKLIYVQYMYSYRSQALEVCSLSHFLCPTPKRQYAISYQMARSETHCMHIQFLSTSQPWQNLTCQV